MTTCKPAFMPEAPSFKAINALYLDYQINESRTLFYQRRVWQLRMCALCIALLAIISTCVGYFFVTYFWTLLTVIIGPLLGIAATLAAVSKLLSPPPAFRMYSLDDVSPRDFSVLKITPEIKKDMNMIFKDNLCAQRYMKQLAKHKRSLYVFEYRLLIKHFFNHYVSRYRPQ